MFTSGPDAKIRTEELRGFIKFSKKDLDSTDGLGALSKHLNVSIQWTD
jgi:hypothetical protein